MGVVHVEDAEASEVHPRVTVGLQVQSIEILGRGKVTLEGACALLNPGLLPPHSTPERQGLKGYTQGG